MFASTVRSAVAASRRSALASTSSTASSSSSSSGSSLARRQLTTSAQLSADVASSAKATAEAAAKGAKATVEATASGAKATAETAQSQLGNVAEKAKQLGGPYAERAQSIFSSITESVVYNLRTEGALAKQVYVAKRLAPPTSTESILSACKSIWAFASNPVQWVRLVQNGEWKKVGVYSVEALGIFTIGEMIGRRSIVGYSLNTKHLSLSISTKHRNAYCSHIRIKTTTAMAGQAGPSRLPTGSGTLLPIIPLSEPISASMRAHLAFPSLSSLTLTLVHNALDAGAKAITVTLDFATWSLECVDDGRGFPVEVFDGRQHEDACSEGSKTATMRRTNQHHGRSL
ncbi:unnamed protein product [Tilletia controversa]|nr:unnamed protein product [Tilletia controversa]